jgi:hypothetical protein
MYDETAAMTIPETMAYKEREGAGIEQYLLQLWPARNTSADPACHGRQRGHRKQ